MKNEYVPFRSTIQEVIKHTDTEYTFRMTYEGEVKRASFLKYPFQNTEKHRFQLVALENTPWILPFVKLEK